MKRPLFEAVGQVENRQFIYLGGHPMAGRERGGFAHATADLFRGAHYILTPDADVPQESIHLLEQLVTFMGLRGRGLFRSRGARRTDRLHQPADARDGACALRPASSV